MRMGCDGPDGGSTGVTVETLPTLVEENTSTDADAGAAAREGGITLEDLREEPHARHFRGG